MKIRKYNEFRNVLRKKSKISQQDLSEKLQLEGRDSISKECFLFIYFNLEY